MSEAVTVPYRTDNRYGARLPRASSSSDAKLSWDCRNGRCTHCSKRDCGCDCHRMEGSK